MKKFKNLPTLLKYYLGFSLIVTVIFYIIQYFFKDVNAILVPYVGWLPASVYMFCICTILPFLFTKSYQKGFSWIIFSQVIGLLLFMTFGISDFYSAKGYEGNNPYLIVSEYRFIWAFVIPSIWIILLIKSYLTIRNQEIINLKLSK